MTVKGQIRLLACFLLFPILAIPALAAPPAADETLARAREQAGSSLSFRIAT